MMKDENKIHKKSDINLANFSNIARVIISEASYLEKSQSSIPSNHMLRA